MCDYDYFLYKENGKLLSKKDVDYAIEMVYTKNWWDRLKVKLKYKFKKNY